MDEIGYVDKKITDISKMKCQQSTIKKLWEGNEWCWFFHS